MLSNALLMLCLFFSANEPADLVVQNATVLTVDEKLPYATSFAVKDGRFVAVGTTADMAPWIGQTTKILDLTGKTVVPGFIDAHAHPRTIFPEDSRWYSVDASPDSVKTMDELVAALKRKAERTPKGQLINGSRYQETKLGRHPTRYDLDRATTDHPIIISHSSGHLSVCNSLALKLANVTKTTANPNGGEFERDEHGEPTGLLKERAAGIVRSACRDETESAPREDKIAAYRTCLQAFLAEGITGVHVAGTDPASARLLAAAQQMDSPVRLYIMLREANIKQATELKAAHQADQNPASWMLRYGAIKSYHGNSLSGQTAWLYEPYAHKADYFGIPPARSKNELLKLVENIHTAGLQACIHANGDREIEMVLDAYQAVMARHPRAEARHRIEHASVLTANLAERIRQQKIVIAPHSYIYEHGDKMEVFGAQRWPWMHANKTLLEQGTIVAGNSDYPVSAAKPMLRLHDLVNRRSAEGKVYGPEQCLSFEQALQTYTLGSAYAEFAEKHKGTISVGKLSDFVVLAADPRKVDPFTIKDVSVLQTYVSGACAYSK